MQVKEIKPINFLYFKTETQVNALAGFVKTVAKSLHLEAAKLSLDVTGPVYWNYFDFKADITQPFILEISIPLAELPETYNGQFQVKRATTFKCLSAFHYGAWHAIPETYAKVMQYIQHHQLTPTGINRELYINCDFTDNAGNFTEIQIGIL